MFPKVSVVVPAYLARYLGRAIDSARIRLVRQDNCGDA